MSGGAWASADRPEIFRFECRPDMACFTKCCANLQLVLTPYDILRLKNRLGVSSGAFLERYTKASADPTTGLPVVRLKMEAGGAHHCPFLAPAGCSVYSDRPGACRLYPLGRVAATQHENRGPRYYFQVREPHCQGWQAKKEWTIPEWLSDQGMDKYNAMNESFLQIGTGRPLAHLRKLGTQHLQAYYTACYDLDEFRGFVLGSSFLERFEIAAELLPRIQTDDTALIQLAGKWLRFSLFGENTLTVRHPPTS